MSEEIRTIPTWLSMLRGAVVGVPTALVGALIPLSFHFADSQFFALFFFFPIWGLILGLVAGFAARKPSKKHPERSWNKRMLPGMAVIFSVSFIIAVPMVI